MEPIAEVQSVFTEDLYIEFNKAHLKLLHLNTRLWTLVVVLLGGGTFIFVLDLLTSRGKGFSYLGTVIAFWILGGFLCLFNVVFNSSIHKLGVKSMLKSSAGQLGLPFTLRFLPAEYIEYTPRGELHTAYSMLYRIVETDRLILLYHNKMQAHILEKGRFTRGTPEELLTYLRSVCPATYKRLRM